jgi:predicted nucleic acid-binding Zn ribbon protein
MMYYECTGCGRIDRLAGAHGDDAYHHCAPCEERTRWTVAFEGEGVSP